MNKFIKLFIYLFNITTPHFLYLFKFTLRAIKCQIPIELKDLITRNY